MYRGLIQALQQQHSVKCEESANGLQVNATRTIQLASAAGIYFLNYSYV